MSHISIFYYIFSAFTLVPEIFSTLSFNSEYYWRIEPNVKCESILESRLFCDRMAQLTRLGMVSCTQTSAISTMIHSCSCKIIRWSMDLRRFFFIYRCSGSQIDLSIICSISIYEYIETIPSLWDTTKSEWRAPLYI